jgi:hypothetical protein
MSKKTVTQSKRPAKGTAAILKKTPRATPSPTSEGTERATRLAGVIQERAREAADVVLDLINGHEYASDARIHPAARADRLELARARALSGLNTLREIERDAMAIPHNLRLDANQSGGT